MAPTPVPAPSPTATARAAPATVPPVATAPPASGVGAPVRLLIPSIGVDAAVEQVATDADGNMATPADPWNTAWYAPGPRPGQPGNAAIAGHVDYNAIGPVVFWDLRNLAPGSEVLVVTDSGMTLRFVVRDSAYYRPENAPLAAIFGPSAEANLNLITCGGTFNPVTRQYDQRLVVFAAFAGSR
jgi:sortase (surface protein transpeptidase)